MNSCFSFKRGNLSRGGAAFLQLVWFDSNSSFNFRTIPKPIVSLIVIKNSKQCYFSTQAYIGNPTISCLVFRRPNIESMNALSNDAKVM